MSRSLFIVLIKHANSLDLITPRILAVADNLAQTLSFDYKTISCVDCLWKFLWMDVSRLDCVIRKTGLNLSWTIPRLANMATSCKT